MPQPNASILPNAEEIYGSQLSSPATESCVELHKRHSVAEEWNLQRRAIWLTKLLSLSSRRRRNAVPR